MAKFESTIKHSPYEVSKVYAKLSDLNNLSVIREKFNDPATLEKFGGQVPADHAALKSLAGVGQKTANVVYAVAFGGDAIAVDTHVFRVSNRLGLASASTPEKTEEQLKEIIPRSDWSRAHHWLIYHGRRVCHSQRPDCANCTLKNWCASFNGTKTR